MLKESRRIWVFIGTMALLGWMCARPAWAAPAEGSFERTLKVTGPVDLEVATGSGDIRVKQGASSTVHIYGRIKTSWSWFGGGSGEEKVRYLEEHPPIEQNGNTIRIGHIEEPQYRNNVSISYEIEVPAETRLVSKTGSGDQSVEGIDGPVEASTGSGDVDVNNVGGEVRANTGSGDIVADTVHGSLRAHTGSGSITGGGIGGAIEAGTGSGRIRLEQTAPGDVEVSAGSGDIEVNGVDGALQAGSGSGSIEISGKPAGDWRIHAGSGDVTLRVGGSAFDLYARTDSGSISTEQPITVSGKIARREVRGKVRGGGNLVEVRTGSGNITIQ